ncbi:signal transducing adapter molecule 2 isoform X2 [Tribolium madens]|uniref:signal transducing adapter molecule 2 isoform X2 n=1 Tax=Tribolium madens TaxID=41895 RepID=UPI001CF74D8A|nr:signal transducing adapter molecule 2 isoform X2 [Tribolium madens]
MGIFGTTSDTIADEVEKATHENNSEENWELIINICDKAGKSPEDAKAYLRAVIKRLHSQDPHIAIQAVTLLDACVKNSGKLFHVEVASREFENEYTKLLQKSHVNVSRKLREALKRWAENEFKTDQQLNLIPSLYTKLKNSGVDFTFADMPAKKSTPVSKDPNVVESQEEENQILKAIELSLKESSSSSPRASSASGSLYPSANLAAANSSTNSTPVKEPKKVRALYDFEAAEDNELTFKSGEIIFVIDDSDPNWWKGNNQRGEGLFPSNFVTKDLDVEPEKFLYEKAKKIVQFKETVEVKPTPEDIEINEEKIDRLLHLLHEADPTNPETDTEEMLKLEREVNLMGPLIDSELERVDKKHAQLTQLSADLVEALGLYHSLMREPQFPPKMPYNYPQQPPNSMTYNGLPPQPPMGMGAPLPPPPGMHYATMPMMSTAGMPPPPPPQFMMHQMPDDRRTQSYGSMVPPNFPSSVAGSQTLIHNGPPPQSQSQHYMPPPK